MYPKAVETVNSLIAWIEENRACQKKCVNSILASYNFNPVISENNSELIHSHTPVSYRHSPFFRSVAYRQELINDKNNPKPSDYRLVKQDYLNLIAKLKSKVL